MFKSFFRLKYLVRFFSHNAVSVRSYWPWWGDDIDTKVACNVSNIIKWLNTSILLLALPYLSELRFWKVWGKQSWSDAWRSRSRHWPSHWPWSVSGRCEWCTLSTLASPPPTRVLHSTFEVSYEICIKILVKLRSWSTEGHLQRALLNDYSSTVLLSTTSGNKSCNQSQGSISTDADQWEWRTLPAAQPVWSPRRSGSTWLSDRIWRLNRERSDQGMNLTSWKLILPKTITKLTWESFTSLSRVRSLRAVSLSST